MRTFWGKRVYPPQPISLPQDTTPDGENLEDKDFENWHTAMQYIEMIQFVATGRRKSSAIALE